MRKALDAVRGIRREAQRLDLAPLHPFPARMPLSIARFLISRLTHPDATVLDPMVGSGTTLIAAKLLGRVGLGFDLDPLAITLSRASTMTADPSIIAEAGNRVLDNASRALLHGPGHRRPEPGRQASTEHRAFLDYWFPERSQEELSALSNAIRAERDHSTQAFLWSVFSSLIVAKSAGASYALDLSHSRPHKDLDKKILWPFEAWTPRFQRALGKLHFRAGTHQPGQVKIAVGDARSLCLGPSTVDLVLTSPPYLQAIDYIRAHKFALVWMGYDLAFLRQTRSVMIGAQRMLASPDGLPQAIEKSLTEGIPLGSRRGHIRRYLSDLNALMKEIYRVLKPGGLAILVLGPSIISRTRYDTVDLLMHISADIGLEVVSTVARRLSSQRRALPPPHRVQAGNNLRKRMRSEVFVAMRKPGPA